MPTCTAALARLARTIVWTRCAILAVGHMTDAITAAMPTVDRAARAGLSDDTGPVAAHLGSGGRIVGRMPSGIGLEGELVIRASRDERVGRRHVGLPGGRSCVEIHRSVRDFAGVTALILFATEIVPDIGAPEHR